MFLSLFRKLSRKNNNIKTKENFEEIMEERYSNDIYEVED